MNYAVFSLSALFVADVATQTMGARWGLFLGGASVALFMFSEGGHLLARLAGSDMSWLVVVGAAVNGLGNAVLWVSQFWVLVRCSTTRTRGRYWGELVIRGGEEDSTEILLNPRFSSYLLGLHANVEARGKPLGVALLGHGRGISHDGRRALLRAGRGRCAWLGPVSLHPGGR